MGNKTLILVITHCDGSKEEKTFGGKEAYPMAFAEMNRMISVPGVKSVAIKAGKEQ